jgi:hypothetical protein
VHLPFWHVSPLQHFPGGPLQLLPSAKQLSLDTHFASKPSPTTQSALGLQHCLPSSFLPHRPPSLLQNVFSTSAGVENVCIAAAAVAAGVTAAAEVLAFVTCAR